MDKVSGYRKLLKNFPQFFSAASPQTWADFGCGNGVFTEVLASFLPSGSKIFAIDKNPRIFPGHMRTGIEVTFQQSDFVHDKIELPPLTGILMANSLHFVEDKETFIRRLSDYFPDETKLIIVEYDRKMANPYVPFPIDFETFNALLRRIGFSEIEKAGTHPSQFGGEMYSCFAVKN